MEFRSDLFYTLAKIIPIFLIMSKITNRVSFYQSEGERFTIFFRLICAFFVRPSQRILIGSIAFPQITPTTLVIRMSKNLYLYVSSSTKTQLSQLCSKADLIVDYKCKKSLSFQNGSYIPEWVIVFLRFSTSAVNRCLCHHSLGY